MVSFPKPTYFAPHKSGELVCSLQLGRKAQTSAQRQNYWLCFPTEATSVALLEKGIQPKIDSPLNRHSWQFDLMQRWLLHTNDWFINQHNRESIKDKVMIHRNTWYGQGINDGVFSWPQETSQDLSRAVQPRERCSSKRFTSRAQLADCTLVEFVLRL